MSDPGGFDPCECLWNHELAMQRLISLLRSSQSYCTDNECISDLPGLQGQQQAHESNIPFLVLCWVVLAMALFFLRPSSTMRQGDVKPSDNQGPGPQPPTPPPAVN
ncbi:small integral membrane protein 14-like [Daphnia carinata]|uniref:small integral membrane protein 14-like n=1 Tax=Daphnia carinata TaxID=120202 RepID=UPI002580295E|nr:small integral membrane protein 14-like [Daphnia carinata]